MKKSCDNWNCAAGVEDWEVQELDTGQTMGSFNEK